MMECGVLDLMFELEYGLLLLGKTKAGKTTSSHYLSHSVLEGGYNDRNNIVYKLKEGGKNSLALVGDDESKSQTRIPNLFQFTSDGKTMHLVDCPGYLDSYGFYRIISNRFFHFQVFSKVKNAKFIITFTWDDMRKSADNVNNTFKEFLNGFSN